MAEQRRSDGESGAGKARPQGGGARPPSGRPVWVFSEPPSEVVAELSRRFPKVIKLPEEEVKTKTEDWLLRGLVARSLGRRISPEAAIREFRFRGGLKGDVSGFSIENGFMLFRFKEEADRDLVINRPWSVNGSVLALEPWRARFVPAADAIQTAMVWVRLPLLPVELWGAATLKSIVEDVGDLVVLDDCTSQCRRLGFARAAVRVSLVKPLQPGALIEGPQGCRWQPFVYEELTGICFSCGMFHCIGGDCLDRGNGGTAGLHPANTLQPEDLGEGGSLGERGLGPWLLAVRRWLPATRKEEQPGPSAQSRDAKVANSESGGRGKEGPTGQRSGAVPVGGGWVKPVKVARRSSPTRPSSPVEGSSRGSRFGALRVADGGAGSGSAADPFGGGGSGSAADSASAADPVSVSLALVPVGRFKRARPTPKLPGPSGKELDGKFLGPTVMEKGILAKGGGGGLILEGDFMDVMPGQEGQFHEMAKGKGKIPIEATGREPREFIFTAKGLKGGPSNPIKPIMQDADIHPTSALLLLDQAHTVAVGRLRQVIEEDGDRSMLMEDTDGGVDEVREGGGSGATPSPHQVSE